MRAWMTRETPAGAAAEAPDEVPGPPPPGVPMPQEGHAEEGKEETKSTAVKMSLQEKQEAAKQAEAKVAAMSGAAIRADPSCIGGIDPRAGQPGWIVEGVVARTRPALSGGASALIKHPAIVIVAAPTGGSAEKKRSNENTAVTEQWIVLVTHLYRDADKEVMTMDLTKDRWALCNGQPCFRLVRLVIMQPSPNPCSPLPTHAHPYPTLAYPVTQFSLYGNQAIFRHYGGTNCTATEKTARLKAAEDGSHHFKTRKRATAMSFEEQFPAHVLLSRVILTGSAPQSLVVLKEMKE